MKSKRLIRVFAVAGLSGGLVACGGSSSSGGNAGEGERDDTVTASTGAFLDSAVEGLEYSSRSHSGITNAAGEFEYQPGELITFHIGDVVLGRVVGGEVRTPLDLGNSASNAHKVTNVLRLLQSLDPDGPEDGIHISGDVRAVANTVSLDFDVSSAAFEASEAVAALVAAADADLVSADDALEHFRGTISSLPANTIDMRGPWKTVMTHSSCPDVQAIATLTYTDAGLALAGDAMNYDNGECVVYPYEQVTLPYDNENVYCGPVCDLVDYNSVVHGWEGGSTVIYSHTEGSDVITRVRIDFDQAGEESGRFIQTMVREQAWDYEIDMRGTWEWTMTNSACPGTEASATMTYADDHMTMVGTELYTDGMGDATTCRVDPLNETVFYDSEDLPEDFCAPTCGFQELNGAYRVDGNSLVILSHALGTGVINREKRDSNGHHFTQTLLRK